MESTRQKKVSKLIEHDMANIFQTVAQREFKGTLISVTKVRITPDLGIARIYLSIFPSDKSESVMDYTERHKSAIRNEFGQVTRNQLRIIPELEFFKDDSLDYIDQIDNLLKGRGDNPIK